MSSKEFKKNQESQTDETPVIEVSSIEYQSWFSRSLKSNEKLQAHHYPVILSFFKSQQLTEVESESAYDAALKKFGY